MRFLVSVLITLALQGFAGEVEVVLLGGQSNMQGIGRLEDLDEELPSVIPHAYFFTGDTFESLVLGKVKTSAREGEFGPEVGLALTLARPERPVYLVKYYASGMALHHGWDGGNWTGGGPAAARRNFYPGEGASDGNQGILYRRMLQRFRTALRQLKEDGHTPVVRGLVWMQGEQDSKHAESASNYAVNLKRLHARLGEDLDLEGDLPMVFGQVLPHEPAASRFTHRDEIRRQMTLADGRSSHGFAITNARMVSTDRFSLLPDTVHYDARGQLELGKAFGNRLGELLGELNGAEP